MLVRSSVLAQVGPFDPIFGSYCEDYDLCRRAAAAGHRVGICTGGRVAHFSGSSSISASARSRRTRLVIRSRAIHRIRQAGNRRLRALAGYFGWHVPYNLGRCLAATTSAQALGDFVRAHCELLGVVHRLASQRRDVELWQGYLKQLDWPPARKRAACAAQAAQSAMTRAAGRRAVAT
jgi:GT2 family glycosyltransferase